MASEGEPFEPLTYKIWVLKVSIHCQGCKRKVNKILHAIEGVYTVNIDLKEQKVIVKGNVAAETLIRKLIKSGKHAELWPEPAPEQKMKKSRKSKKKNKETELHSTSEEEEDDEDDEQNDHSAPDAQKQADPTGKIFGGAVVVTGGAGNQPPVAGNGGFAEKTGSGGKRKKKKKKGQKTVTIVEPTGGGGPMGTLPQDHQPSPTPMNLGPPPHHGYHQFPTHFQAPSPVPMPTPMPVPVPTPVPMYPVSYNTIHPTTGYRTSYYSAPPPPSYTTNISHTTPYYTSPSRCSYGYAYNGPQVESPPSDSEYYRRKSPDSLELFSDENPNGCLIL